MKYVFYLIMCFECFCDNGVWEMNWSRWSCTGIKAYAMGELEARKLKYPTTGTEALLMGILIEG